MTQNTTINTSHTVTSPPPLPVLMPVLPLMPILPPPSTLIPIQLPVLPVQVLAADDEECDVEEVVLLKEAIVITNKNITFINDSNENIINGLKR